MQYEFCYAICQEDCPVDNLSSTEYNCTVLPFQLILRYPHLAEFGGWRRARLENAIKDLMDTGLPRAYSTDLYRQKSWVVFEYFYEFYPERDAKRSATAGISRNAHWTHDVDGPDECTANGLPLPSDRKAVE